MSKLSKWTKKAERAVSNAIPHQHSADRRAANEAVSQQIDYYKQAKETMGQETARADVEREESKKKISQKQIKSAQRAYRSPGFLEDASGDLSNTLG